VNQWQSMLTWHVQGPDLDLQYHKKSKTTTTTNLFYQFISAKPTPSLPLSLFRTPPLFPEITFELNNSLVFLYNSHIHTHTLTYECTYTHNIHVYLLNSSLLTKLKFYIGL
jgi:hypothetical protein